MLGANQLTRLQNNSIDNMLVEVMTIDRQTNNQHLKKHNIDVNDYNLIHKK